MEMVTILKLIFCSAKTNRQAVSTRECKERSIPFIEWIIYYTFIIMTEKFHNLFHNFSFHSFHVFRFLFFFSIFQEFFAFTFTFTDVKIRKSVPMYIYGLVCYTQKMMIIEKNMNFQINPFTLNSAERTNKAKRKITLDTREEEKKYRIYIVETFLSVWCSMLMDAFSASFLCIYAAIHVHPIFFVFESK